VGRRWRLHAFPAPGRSTACYRAGRFEDAARHFQRVLEADPGWKAHVCNWLGLCLANQRLGKTDEARRWLDKARQAPPETLAMPHLHPHDWLDYRLLLREAEAALGEGKEPR
jgi:tetratricopeptide (TPR) repeat protein